jgi:outer membrane receptor for ferrienterochelin and colicin
LDISFGAYYNIVFRDKLVVDAPNLSDNYVNLDAGLSRDNRKQTWAIFSQASYSISKKLSFLAGLRVEQTPSYKINYAVRFDPSQTYTYLSRQGTYQYGKPYLIPRLALLYHINDNNHLKLMYGVAIKQASMGENMDIVRYPDREQLKPADMNTMEMNYIGLISNKFSFNFSLFQNNVNNLISRTNQIENGVMRLFNTNSGKLKTLGSEFGMQLKLTSNFNSTFSVVYQKSKNLQKGYSNIALEYAPKLLAYTTLSYKFYKNATIGLSGYYVDEMETYWRPATSLPGDTRDPIQLIADGNRIGDKSPAYLLLNSNLRFNNLFKKNMYLNAYIYNLLNTEVRYPTTRSNDEFEKGTLGYNRYFCIEFGVIIDSAIKGKSNSSN